MGLILSIETTTTNCSVSLGKKGKLKALKEFNSKTYSHSEKLHLFIKQIFDDTDYKLNDLEAVAISKGPGSYTGLRIGTSTAKGLCFAQNIPLIAIDTLRILFKSSKKAEYDFIIPLLDARRMEVYTAIFDAEGNKLAKTAAKVLDETSFSNQLNKGKVLFIGNGVDKFKKLCQHKNACFSETLPSAKEMITLAEDRYNKKKFEDVAYFEPFYLKDFIAKK